MGGVVGAGGGFTGTMDGEETVPVPGRRSG